MKSIMFIIFVFQYISIFAQGDPISATEFPKMGYADLYFASDWGIYVAPSMKKVYLEGARVDTAINGDYYLNYDIIVNSELLTL